MRLDQDSTDGDIGQSQVQDDDAAADVSDDDDSEMPVFNSTPKPGQSGHSTTHGSSQETTTDTFINTLYDSIVTFGARVQPGTCQNVSEVGMSIDELNDHLLAAETDPQSSRAYDVRVLQCLLTTKKVPQRLSLLCMDAPEVSQGQTIRFV